MPRPNYPSNPGSSRPYEQRYNSRQNSEDIDDILNKIKQQKNLSDLSVEEIAKENGIAERLAKSFGSKLNTTQLRKFFDGVVTNQENLNTNGWKAIESDFYMIRPNLAYAKGRKLIPDGFYNLVSLCLERVATAGSPEPLIKENYSRFVELMQALVAYHKYYFSK